jgi:hypothetical protein
MNTKLVSNGADNERRHWPEARIKQGLCLMASAKPHALPHLRCQPKVAEVVCAHSYFTRTRANPVLQVPVKESEVENTYSTVLLVSSRLVTLGIIKDNLVFNLYILLTESEERCGEGCTYILS